MLKEKMNNYKPCAYFCEQLGISRTTWWRWAKREDFPKPIHLGRHVRWPVDQVEQYVLSDSCRTA